MFYYLIIGYKYYGLDGLGIAFLLSNFLYFIKIFYIAKNKYNFSLNKSFTAILVSQLVLLISCFLSVLFLTGIYVYVAGSVFIILSSYLAFIGLDKRIGIKSLLIKLINSKKWKK